MATWSRLNFTALELPRKNPGFRGGATQDVGILQISEQGVWKNCGSGPEGGFFVVDPDDPSVIYTAPWGYLRRSKDGGKTWETILNGISSSVLDHAHNIWHLAVDPYDSKHILCVSASKVYSSNDQGDSWKQVYETNGKPTRIAFTPGQVDRCYLVTNTGRVYRSDAGGDTGSWKEPYAAEHLPSRGAMLSLAVDWNDPDIVYIGAGGYGSKHVYLSVNGGATWTAIDHLNAHTSFPDVPVNCLVIDPSNSETLYAATEIGVFRARHGGRIWEQFSLGIPCVQVTELATRRSTRVLYASTMGRGVFSRQY